MIVVAASRPPSYAAWNTSTTVMSSSASYVLSGPSSASAMMRPFTLESPAYLAHMFATWISISFHDDTSSSVTELLTSALPPPAPAPARKLAFAATAPASSVAEEAEIAEARGARGARHARGATATARADAPRAETVGLATVARIARELDMMGRARELK